MSVIDNVDFQVKQVLSDARCVVATASLRVVGSSSLPTADGMCEKSAKREALLNLIRGLHAAARELEDELGFKTLSAADAQRIRNAPDGKMVAVKDPVVGDVLIRAPQESWRDRPPLT